jgi:hypothetical protein
MAKHEVTFRRRTRGRSAVYNRPLYGYTVVCSCGWEQKVNGTLRKATAVFNAHKRAK